MSELGPGPATDIDPGIPNRDLRDEIFLLDGYDPLPQEPIVEEEVPAYLEPAPKPERRATDYHGPMMALAGVAVVFTWMAIAPVVGVMLGIAGGFAALIHFRKREESG